ncbi:MAG: hypothetical protein IJ115_02770 [Erysipelotrichaceae bacterium]|nr:hypothetical protein [Erysipelotrichaceae bacterium]
MYIQQSVIHEKDNFVKGTYVVSSNDPEYKAELKRDNKRIGYVNFYYDAVNNKLDFDFKYCKEYVSRNYQELVEIIWNKIRLIKSFWYSSEFDYRAQIIENQLVQ